MVTRGSSGKGKEEWGLKRELLWLIAVRSKGQLEKVADRGGVLE